MRRVAREVKAARIELRAAKPEYKFAVAGFFAMWLIMAVAASHVIVRFYLEGGDWWRVGYPLVMIVAWLVTIAIGLILPWLFFSRNKRIQKIEETS